MDLALVGTNQQSDAISGKRFPQKGQRMGDRIEKKEWGREKERGKKKQESKRGMRSKGKDRNKEERKGKEKGM